MTKKLEKKWMFTSLQKKWIHALKTTKRKQGQGTMCSDESGHKKHCCLAIGAECVLKIKPVYNPEDMDYFYNKRRGDLSQKDRLKLGLTEKGQNLCVEMNDDLDYKFKQIAKELETYPEKFFKKSK